MCFVIIDRIQMSFFKLCETSMGINPVKACEFCHKSSSDAISFALMSDWTNVHLVNKVSWSETGLYYDWTLVQMNTNRALLCSIGLKFYLLFKQRRLIFRRKALNPASLSKLSFVIFLGYNARSGVSDLVGRKAFLCVRHLLGNYEIKRFLSSN